MSKKTGPIAFPDATEWRAQQQARTMAKTLIKTLSKIKRLTKTVVMDAEYDTSYAGRVRNSYQQERGWRKHLRDVGKLNRLCTKAETLADFFDKPILSCVRVGVDCAREAVGYCDRFPKSKEWRGTEPLKLSQNYLSHAQKLLRGTL